MLLGIDDVFAVFTRDCRIDKYLLGIPSFVELVIGNVLDDRASFLLVDEFQNFATMSFTQMLSEARKYKVYLTMAEQSTQQQDDQKLVNIILANVGTVVVFRTGSPKDEELLLPLFEPYIEKGEISNLPAYNFYCRITGIDSQEPMSGETIVYSNASKRNPTARQ